MAETESNPSSSPILIPVHNDSSSTSSDGPPEWAMIELNGELIAPVVATPAPDKENPTMMNDAASLSSASPGDVATTTKQNDAAAIFDKDQVELGSVRSCWEYLWQ